MSFKPQAAGSIPAGRILGIPLNHAGFTVFGVVRRSAAQPPYLGRAAITLPPGAERFIRPEGRVAGPSGLSHPEAAAVAAG